jgi:hypothetical protein
VSVLLGPGDFHDAAKDAAAMADKANEIIDLAKREPMVGIPGVATVGLVLAGLKRLFGGGAAHDWNTRG